jgi:hypothetical protein
MADPFAAQGKLKFGQYTSNGLEYCGSWYLRDKENAGKEGLLGDGRVGW